MADMALPAFRLRWLIGAMACALAAVVGWAVWVVQGAPDVTQLRQVEAARPSVLMSADGQLLGRMTTEHREPVTLNQIAAPVVDALIATEDRRFHQHRGVDWRRTVAALWHSATGDLQGGSTITQQLARNLFPDRIGRKRSLTRKLREMVTALRIERNFSKQQILEAYLNSAPFLYNAVGIEMAARTYYDKPASALNTLESATLVGMLKGSSYYNPVRHPERARARRNVVLSCMARQGFLTDAAYRELATAPMHARFNRPANPADAAPHFVAQVRRQLVEWADEHDYNLASDGLVIQTTLDARLQALAVQAVEAQTQALQAVADVEWSQRALPAGGSLESYARRATSVDPFAHFLAQQPELLREWIVASPRYRKALAEGGDAATVEKALRGDRPWLAALQRSRTRLEAGFVAIDPRSGAVRAWVGSRDHEADQFDHVAQAERQPGSTFKPFVYGAALESGVPSAQTYVDGAVEVPLGDGRVWRPTDMRGASGEPMTLRDGLALSKNTITVQVAQQVGVARVAALARAMGVDRSKLDVVPSLALGTSSVTLLEMVSAYATLADEGTRREPLLVQRIADRHGRVLAEFGSEPRRALSAASAIELVDMLRGVIDRGTGTMVRTRFGIDVDAAGKTGTTQDNTDGWFILMRPDLVAGAWVGFNDARVTMRSNYWGQGGHNAILLVGDFFRGALKARLVDGKARFAVPPSPPPGEVALEAPAEPGPSLPPRTHDDALPAAPSRDEGAPKTAMELERSLAAMRYSAMPPSIAVTPEPALAERPGRAASATLQPGPRPGADNPRAPPAAPVLEVERP